MSRLDTYGVEILEPCPPGTTGAHIRSAPKGEFRFILKADIVVLQLGAQGCRLLVLATSSFPTVIDDLRLSDSFDSQLQVPTISDLTSLGKVLKEVQLFKPLDASEITDRLASSGHFGRDKKLQIGIKKLLSVIERVQHAGPADIMEQLAVGIHSIGSGSRGRGQA